MGSCGGCGPGVWGELCGEALCEELGELCGVNV